MQFQEALATAFIGRTLLHTSKSTVLQALFEMQITLVMYTLAETVALQVFHVLGAAMSSLMLRRVPS